MPISIFEHIIQQSNDNRYGRGIAPEQALSEMLLECFTVRSETFPSHGLAFSDAIPTAVLLGNAYGTATFRSGAQPFAFSHAWVSGQYLENVHLELIDPGEEMLIIRFNPLFFNQFSLTSANTLRNRPAWDLAAVFGEQGEILLCELASQTETDARIRVLEAVLKRQKTGGGITNHLLQEAIRYIRARKGNVHIGHLAATLHVGYKWLERNFIKATGVSPKEFARQQRFIHTYFDLLNEPAKDLPEIAFANAFYDQNHLSKEFKKFSGCSPAWFRKNNGRCKQTNLSNCKS